MSDDIAAGPMQERKAAPIHGFFGDYRFLSNFWPAPIRVELFNRTMFAPTNEHAYQAAKTFDPDKQTMVLSLITPQAAKRAGRDLVLRDGWDDLKLEVMTRIQIEKYKQHKVLRQKLKSTGDAYIEETNKWGDTFWGVCNGVGENNLGKILMALRGQL